METTNSETTVMDTTTNDTNDTNDTTTNDTNNLNPIEIENINKQSMFYRNMSVRFIETNRIDLVRIYRQHLEKDGSGILAINFSEVAEKKNVDVTYILLEILPIDMVEKINERKQQNDSNIIYFLLITPFEEKIIEIDIRTLVA